MENVLSPLFLFQKGGPLMIVLLIFSILVLGLIIAKCIQFSKAGVLKSSTIADQLQQSIQNLKNYKNGTAHKKSRVAHHLFSRAIHLSGQDGLGSEQAEIEMTRLGTKEIRQLESGLKALSIIGFVSPLVGLLGTVLGLIEAFSQIDKAQQAIHPALLAGGIWEALLTTAAGLTVSIFALLGYYYFESRIDQIRADLQDGVIQIFQHFHRHKVKYEIDDTQQPIDEIPNAV